jgi:MinD superfamily P-loop ATPase
VKELVVISGKGGTGKTSLVASFAALARDAVLADCDVDAPDLHLVLAPEVREKTSFVGGALARVKPGHCVACAKCEEVCRFQAILFDGPGNGLFPRTFRVDEVACEGCGVCAWFCAEGAIAFEPAVRGHWFVSDTRFGPMVHARLLPGAGSSGKLVSLVREQARALAERERRALILVDGSPGIGCPVIASLTLADLVLAVSEPSVSGQHDLARVLELARSLGRPAALCVNRADLNPAQAERMERAAEAAGVRVLPRVRFDPAVSRAQNEGRAVVELGPGPAAQDIEKGWRELCRLLEER